MPNDSRFDEVPSKVLSNRQNTGLLVLRDIAMLMTNHNLRGLAVKIFSKHGGVEIERDFLMNCGLDTNTFETLPQELIRIHAPKGDVQEFITSVDDIVDACRRLRKIL